MWPFGSRLGKRTAAVAAKVLGGAAVGVAAGVLFGFLYGALLGLIRGDLAMVLVVVARFALAGGIAGLLVTSVGTWAEGEGVEVIESVGEELHGPASKVVTGRIADGTAESRRLVAGPVPSGVGSHVRLFRLPRRL